MLKNLLNSLLMTEQTKIQKEELSEINKNILSRNNFSTTLELTDKDLNIFYLMTQSTDNNIINMIEFISHKNDNYYDTNNIKINEEFPNFILKQTFLLFYYFSKIENQNCFKVFQNLYKDIYAILLKFYQSMKIFNYADFLEICRFNIVLGIINIKTKEYIFNSTINCILNLNDFIEKNKENFDENIKTNINNSMKMLFETLYLYLSNNLQSLIFLQRYEKIENAVLFNIYKFYTDDDKNSLNSFIVKILNLVYCFNYRKLINELLLKEIQNSFCCLTLTNKEKICDQIKLLGTQVKIINNLYKEEIKFLDGDIYMPKNYFVFNESEQNGINCFPSCNIFEKNFILIFSFKLKNVDKNYPLLTIISEDNKEILLNFSFQNKKINFLYQNGYQEATNLLVEKNKTYLIIFEYIKDKDDNSKSFIIINDNEEKKIITSNIINCDKKNSIILGYLPSNIKNLSKSLNDIQNNFIGIMGSVIIFPGIEKEIIGSDDNYTFANNLFKLKGFYDYLLYLTPHTDMQNLFKFENKNILYHKDYLSAKDYLTDNLNLLIKNDFFILSPLSIINRNDYHIKKFICNVYTKNFKIMGDNQNQYFTTMDVPSPYTEATFSKIHYNTLQGFVKNDGFNFLILILEYYYNILKMILNRKDKLEFDEDNKYLINDEINKSICPIIDIMTNIIKFFKIDYFNIEIDKYGFSLMKVINLLGDISPLSQELINCFNKNMELLISSIVNTRDINQQISNFIRNFANKYFTLICTPRYYDQNNEDQMILIFKLFSKIITNNEELIPIETSNLLTQFNFVLDCNNSNEKSKSMKRQYKTLINQLILQNESITFYSYFFFHIFQRNDSVKIKYKLSKIYYKILDENSLIRNYNDNPENIDKIDSKTFWNLFKSQKKKDNNPLKDINAISNKYNNLLLKIIGIRYKYNNENERYHELIKCIIIQLVYGQVLQYALKLNDEKIYFFSKEAIKQKKKDIFSQNKTRSRDASINKKSKTIKDNSGNISTYFSSLFSKGSSIDSGGKSSGGNPDSYFFDPLLIENNLSFYMYKSLFCCLFDNWDKINKFKFIKDTNDIDNLSHPMFVIKNIGDFSRNKSELLFQLVELLSCIDDKKTLTNSLKLIYTFLFKVIVCYKLIPTVNASQEIIDNYKKIFYTIFADKYVMNKLFTMSINFTNDNITEEMSKYLIESIIKLCNEILEYHPKPFVFSFIKTAIKNKSINKNLIPVLIGISNYIKINLKKDSDDANSTIENEENNNINNIIELNEIKHYLLFNEIRFINCLKKCFLANQIEAQKLLYETKFLFLNTMQNLILSFSSSIYIYNTKCYILNIDKINQEFSLLNKNIFTPSSVNLDNYSTASGSSQMSLASDKSAKEDDKTSKNKNKEKSEIKLLQSGGVKIINNQVLVVDLYELSCIIIYLVWTLNFSPEIKIVDVISNFIKPIYDKFFINQHYLTYYLDLSNQKKINEKNSLVQEKLPPDIIEKIKLDIPAKYQHFILNNNVCVDDNRFATILSFLIMIKYNSLLYLYEKNKGFSSENQMSELKNLFSEMINVLQNDITCIIQIIEKNKENKKLETFFEKAELSSKHFKELQKYYTKFISSINKVKNNLNKNTIENLKNEFTKKYIKEEEDKRKMKFNWMKNPNMTEMITNEENYNDNSCDNDDSVISNKISISSIKRRSLIFGSRRKNDNIEEEKDKDDEINDKNNDQDNFINKNKDIMNKPKNSYYFIDAEKPVLCTKKDVILKNFGYYFYDNYFKDKKFIQMQKYFLKLYPSTNVTNNYGPFEKQMQLNYPTVIKNFSNCNNYYPRLILRPDKKFWKNENLKKSHEYLEDFEKFVKNSNDNKNNCENYMHLEYGHGLLGQNNFNLFSFVYDDENNTSSSLLFQYDCELIYNKNTIKGKIKLLKNFLVYASEIDFDLKEYLTELKYLISSKKDEIHQKNKQIIIPYNIIEQIILRNFLFYSQAIELFLLNGKSYFFNLFSADNCNDILTKIKYIISLKNNNNEIEIITNQSEYFNKKKYTSIWQEGKITTLDYLLLINKFSNRSYNDLTQYLVMPWLLNNYTDIYNNNNFRKMNYCMAIQDKESLDLIKQNYENDIEKRCYLQYHYSNSAFVSLYLVRLNPFSYNQIKINGNFDSPDRQIESLQDMCNVLKDFKENNELIPEYFLMTECFLNLNFYFFGKKSNELGNEGIVNNIKLTNQFSSLLDMIFFHQNFMNSDEISINVNKWIDNIFGENQITTKKNIINSFPPECYEKNVKESIEELKSQLNEYLNNNDVDEKTKDKKKLEIIKAVKLKIDYPYLFGQCPPQLFNRSHPCFSGTKKNRKESNDENSKNDLLNINTSNESEKLLYMNSKSGTNNFYILTNSEIFVYNKNFKLINTLNICKINIPYFYIKDDEINDMNENVIIRNIYKNLIFEIEDCKFFFIGGYLDNTFKIYYKEKNKDKENETIFYSIATESQVTCIKNLTGEKIFFTGHRNGKILKWKFTLENNQIKKIKNINSIIAHKKFVKLIETNNKLNVIVSSSDDGVIFIRKLFDYELLTVIKYNKIYKNILDFCFDKQVLITTFYNKNKNNIKINVYSLNGIKLSKFSDNIKSPITLIPQTDEIILFIESYVFKTKITTFEQGNNVLNSEEFNNVDKVDDCVSSRFIDDVSQNKIISNFYDSNTHAWICLFENGHLYRISLKVEDIK